jgi:hypothetical protein
MLLYIKTNSTRLSHFEHINFKTSLDTQNGVGSIAIVFVSQTKLYTDLDSARKKGHEKVQCALTVRSVLDQ